MDKKEVINKILKKYSNEEINTKNKGNFKFANCDLKKKAYWFTIDLDKRIEEDYYLSFFDKNNEEIILINVPKSTFTKERFSLRNNDFKLDIYLSSEEEFLVDIKAGGTKFNFEPFIIDKIKY